MISSFARDNISFKFYDDIKAIVTQLHPEIKYIEFTVDPMIDNPSNPKVIDCIKEYKDLTSKKKKEEADEQGSANGLEIRTFNDKYTFDNFIV